MLTARHLDRLEERLIEEREEAKRTLRETAGEIAQSEMSDGDLSIVPTHMADRASDVEEDTLDTDIAQKLSDRLNEIDEALLRLRETPAEFDVSVVSGERIPFERLEMVPWTRMLAAEEEAKERAAHAPKR
jgi:RNA polymerase-binding transcription factor DksA